MLTNLRPNADGTVTGWTATGGSGTLASAIAQDPLSHDNGTSYVEAPNVADGSMFVQLRDAPHNFDPDAVNSITIRVAALFVNTPQMTVDTCDLYLQLFRSDETTAMSAESAVCNVTSTAGYVVFERTVALSGTHALADWNGARLRLRQDHTAQQTVDTTARIRITAANVTVDYTASAAVGAVLHFPQRWRRKPQPWMRVDMGHPLARGIRFFVECSGHVAIDLVQGERLTRTGTLTSAYDPKFFGEASVLDSTDNFNLAASLWRDDINGGGISLIWRGYLNSLAGGGHLVSKDEVGDQEFVWYLGGADAFNFLRINAANNNDATWRVTGIDQPTGTWLTYGVAQGNIDATPLAWVNRTPQTATQIGGGATGLGRAATGRIRVGRDTNSLGQLNGRVSHVIGFARQITEAEYLALEENPWQILVPDKRIYIGAVQAAGGGNTVSAVLLTHTYVGQSPKLQAKVQPGALTHTYTAQAPKANVRVQPAQVTHTYVGQAPSITAGQGLTAAVATHAYTGQAPQLRARVQPAQVVHTYVAQTPQARSSVAPGSVAHTYTGREPSIQAGQGLTAAVATHTYVGQAPQARARVQPAQVTHAYTGRVANVQSGAGIFPPTAAHSYVGQAPQAKAQVRAAVVTHTYTGRAPQALVNVRVQPDPVEHDYLARAPQAKVAVAPGPVVHTYTARAVDVQSSDIIPVYGWGARSRLGANPATFSSGSLGSGTATATKGSLGSGTATATEGGLGSVEE